MTLDEAIKHAEEVMIDNLVKTKDRNASDPIAINCFECAKEHRQLAEWLKDYKRLREQTEKRTEERTESHACDCISREAAQKLICEDGTRLERDGVYELTMCAVKQWAVDLLDELPSVEPERKPGKWIDKGIIKNTEAHDFICSECGWHEPDFPERIIELHYCTRCGSRMEVDNGQS